MNLLPLVGLAAGVLIGNRRAFIVTAVAAALGLSLVAVFTDEIDGFGDPYMWVLVVVSAVTTAVGVLIRRWWNRRRMPSVARPEV
ncbi:MAG TPA: hypothetical protein VE693_13455 [Gaiellaceae bacterium]|jgi:hypothetical protein|nr:hypothetical protein [Gaiellaceae bacterium]